MLSDFVMLNFVAIRRGISTTPGTSARYLSNSATFNSHNSYKNELISNIFANFLRLTLVPEVVLIPLRIATKLSMTKSESILEN